MSEAQQSSLQYHPSGDITPAHPEAETGGAGCQVHQHHAEARGYIRHCLEEMLDLNESLGRYLGQDAILTQIEDVGDVGFFFLLSSYFFHDSNSRSSLNKIKLVKRVEEGPNNGLKGSGK